MATKNIFGEPLIPCCFEPVTGFYRDGFCRTDDLDLGLHGVCASMTKEFLVFSYETGNDLITPHPEYHFRGLKPGDKWCLCAARWKEAYDNHVAPPVILEACAEEILNIIPIKALIEHAYKSKH